MKISFIFVASVFSLSSCLDLGGVVSGNRMGGVPLGHSLGNGVLDVEGVCAAPGTTCENCTHAVSCVALPVGWLKVPLHKCPDGQTCNAHLGGCVNEPVPECDVPSQKYQHVCEQVGIFPDAYDCRKFHLCSPPADLPQGRAAEHRFAYCPRHYGYDPANAQCSIKLPHGQCVQKLVPNCNTIGQIGALLTSQNHFYICVYKNLQLQPQIFLCPNGWFFWDNFCRPEPKPKEVATTAQPEVYVTTAKETTEKLDSYKGLSFFSTERSTTYAEDTFLADKFDLTNLETEDSSVQSFDYEINNSFETGFGVVD